MGRAAVVKSRLRVAALHGLSGSLRQRKPAEILTSEQSLTKMSRRRPLPFSRPCGRAVAARGEPPAGHRGGSRVRGIIERLIALEMTIGNRLITSLREASHRERSAAALVLRRAREIAPIDPNINRRLMLAKRPLLSSSVMAAMSEISRSK